MKIDECIEILNAVRQGKPLEYRVKGTMTWLTKEDVLDSDGCPSLNFDEEDYRVKEDRYRAYGMEEFVNDACNHECMLMRKRGGGQVLVPSAISDSGVQCGDFRFNYSELLDRLVWYDDGTPVGVKL